MLVLIIFASFLLKMFREIFHYVYYIMEYILKNASYFFALYYKIIFILTCLINFIRLLFISDSNEKSYFKQLIIMPIFFPFLPILFIFVLFFGEYHY